MLPFRKVGTLPPILKRDTAPTFQTASVIGVKRPLSTPAPPPKFIRTKSGDTPVNPPTKNKTDSINEAIKKQKTDKAPIYKPAPQKPILPPPYPALNTGLPPPVINPNLPTLKERLFGLFNRTGQTSNATEISTEQARRILGNQNAKLETLKKQADTTKANIQNLKDDVLNTRVDASAINLPTKEIERMQSAIAEKRLLAQAKIDRLAADKARLEAQINMTPTKSIRSNSSTSLPSTNMSVDGVGINRPTPITEFDKMLAPKLVRPNRPATINTSQDVLKGPSSNMQVDTPTPKAIQAGDTFPPGPEKISFLEVAKSVADNIGNKVLGTEFIKNIKAGKYNEAVALLATAGITTGGALLVKHLAELDKSNKKEKEKKEKEDKKEKDKKEKEDKKKK